MEIGNYKSLNTSNLILFAEYIDNIEVWKELIGRTDLPIPDAIKLCQKLNIWEVLINRISIDEFPLIFRYYKNAKLMKQYDESRITLTRKYSEFTLLDVGGYYPNQTIVEFINNELKKGTLKFKYVSFACTSNRYKKYRTETHYKTLTVYYWT